MAVMECDPTARVAILKAATPPLTVLVPNVVLPSKNDTVPVAAAGVMTAVNVTGAL